ncbi:MFS transporter [Micromonospora sp. NPDC005220]|uniref:MFS transporter n=1 Tax=Micromonospora sp. NPDC005220 TaxID=3155589 RepID=UPI0033BB7600
MKLVQTYRTLAGKPYFRRYLAGEAVSSLGDAMSDITVVLLALTLARGNSALAVSLATAAYLIPGILTGVFAGRHLGRVSPRTLLLIDSGWRGLWLGLAAAMALLGSLQLWMFVALLALASLTRPANAAGARALLPQLLDRSHLFSGNSLFQGTIQIATMLGPALAGVLAGTVGAGAALAFDALSFLVMVAVLSTMPSAMSPAVRREPKEARTERPGRFADWLSNAQFRPVTSLFLITAVMTVAYGPVVVGLPILIGDRTSALPVATELGLLWSLFGVGMVVGGLIAGSMPSLATTRTAALLTAGWGLTVLVLGLPAPVFVTAAAMLVGGLAYAPFTAIVYTVMQERLPQDRLAEGAAYLNSLKSLTTPGGVLLAGFAVAALGATTAIITAGVLLVAICLFIAARSEPPAKKGAIVDRQLA